MGKKSTVEEPLLFFENFFLDNGLNELQKEFYFPWEQSLEIYPSDVYINKSEELVIHFFDSDEKNLSIPTKLLFVDSLRQRFKKEIQVSKRKINKAVSLIVFRNESPLNYLEDKEKTITKLLTASLDLFEKYPFCRKYLENLLVLIEDSKKERQFKPSKSPNNNSDFSSLEMSKKSLVYRQSVNDKFTKLPFFGTNFLDYDFFEALVPLLAKYDVIEISSLSETTKQLFSIFRSSTPWELKTPIVFKVNNLETVLILDELKKIIPRLSQANIEKSKCFYNNSKKLPFKQGDLNSAHSTIKKKKLQNSFQIRPEIQGFIKDFEKLTRKYHK
jgi:hypothetical protein